MPKPVKVDLEAVEQNPDRASIKYGNKAVVQKCTQSLNPV